MSSRKRKNSPITISEDNPRNKRAKLLSSLWISQTEDRIETTRKFPRRKGTSCSTGASTREEPKQYIVDWQNRHITGRKYKSDRRQKENIDQAIITSRKENSPSKRFRRTGRSSRQRRREKSASLPASRKASVGAHRTDKERPQRTVEGSSSGIPDPGETPGDLSNQVSFTQALTPPELIVLISQHSSFERDSYIRYHSSLSSTNITWSFLQYQDSGIGEFSSLPDNLRSEKFERVIVIPDSQSLPGSSSYVPTSTTSTGNKSVTQPETENCVVSTSSYGASTTFSPSDSVSSHSRIEESSDPIEDSTDPLPPESQDLGAHSLRSKSLSSGASSRFLGVNHTRPGQISRSISDPNPLSHCEQKHAGRISAPSEELLVTSSVKETLTSSDLDTQSQASGELIGDINPSSGKEIDETLSHCSTQSQTLGINRPEGDICAQVQPNQSSHSQATHTTSATSADDLWQSAQLVPEPVNSASQISSGSGNLVSENSELVHASVDSANLGVLIRRHSAVPELFAISEDTVADSQVTQDTESTVLSKRNPNSQSRSHTRSVEDIKDFPLSSIESRDGDIENIPGSIISTLQYPQTLDSRVPPRPSTVSDSDMAEAPQTQTDLSSDATARPIMATAPAGLSLREKLKNMRATSAAISAANTAALKANIEQSHSPLPDNERTPLVIPDKSNTPETPESRLEVQPMEVPVEVPLPMRISRSDPHTPNQPSKLSFQREVSYSQTITTLNPVHLGEMEFVIPLSMNTRVRDQYISTINYYRQAIENLMKDEIPDDGLVEEVREMLSRVNQVTTHVDLVNGDLMTQQQTSPEEEAIWAENCSAKFQFLHHLFHCIRDLDLHIGIIARPGRLLDIIETFLKGRYIVYNRPDTLTRSDSRIAKGRMEVSLIASGEEGAATLPKAANLIVALDGSFDAQDVQIGILRSHLTMVGQLSPIIHLLVYNSAEHIERCLPKLMDPIDRLRKIVSCMTQTRHEVGLLLPDESGSVAAAEEVAAFLEAGGLEKDWALPSIRPIEGIEFLESSQDTDSAHSDAQPVVEQNVAPAPASLKRALDNVEGTSTMQKRPRTTPTPAGEITHISDSATQNSSLTPSAQTVAELRTALLDARNEIAFTKSTFAEREKQLQNTITVTQDRLQDHIESLESLQYRYESLTRSSHLQRDSKISLLSNVTSLEEKLERRAADVANLMTRCERLEIELKDARKALLDSPLPAVAELEGLRQEVKASAQQNAVQQKKIESLTKDFEFTRQQYQQASTSAVELASQNAALEKEVTILTRRASGEATKLALINNDTEVRRHRARVAEIESLLADRDDLLRRKEDELRDLKRGRAAGVQTRGSSVQPRSPRGPGSRGASPAPVGMGMGMGGAGLLGVEMRRAGSGLRWGSG